MKCTVTLVPPTFCGEEVEYPQEGKYVFITLGLFKKWPSMITEKNFPEGRTKSHEKVDRDPLS